ncbi:MAG: spondin domain-containing protein [Bacteroidota bacterium]
MKNLKKIYGILVLLALLAVASCSDDDSTDPVDPIDTTVVVGDISVVLNEVEYLGNRVEIFNNGEESVDLSGYFLCLGPGTYRMIGDLETEGNENLAAGEFLVVSYEMPNATGGLGLYRNNNGFGDADNLVDFVQWGAAGSPREVVASTAGIWTTGEFVPVSGTAENTIIFDGEGDGAANWAETTTVTFGTENSLTIPEPMQEVMSVVINEVDYNAQFVELFNNGNVSIDVSSFWLCLGPGTYVQIGNLTPEIGNLELAVGEFVVLPYTQLSENSGLGLYSTNSFASADAIVDFVQWGEAGSPRENVAVEAGIWTLGEFVPNVRLNTFSIEFDGEGDRASDWNEEANPSLGFANDSENATTRFNVTISNVINYFNAHTFSVPVGETEAGPLTTNGEQYQITFNAVPGAKFTPVTMMGNSNDWFLAPEDLSGIDLFPDGQALNGVDIADQLALYDLGTEADGMPENFPPAGADVGPDDANPLVRLVPGRDGGEIYITAVLDYAAGDGNSAGLFTFTITAINAPVGSPFGSQDDGFTVTPGIVVLHALTEPLFTLGEEDRGVGLEAIAEDGQPGELFEWFTEEGTNGAPLRLASSLSVFSPGLVYAFNTDSDPFFSQGGTLNPASGLEQLAEDGNNAPAVAFFNDLGLPVVASNETTNVAPGSDLTFTIDVPQGRGYKLGIGTMLVQTNDWFISYNNNGVALFGEDGTPFSGTSESDETYLFDAGTEVDQPVGFGADQAPRQDSDNQGAADGDTSLRRVSALNDVQFGKGVINNGPGTTWLMDPRGGYNLIEVNIQPQ